MRMHHLRMLVYKFLEKHLRATAALSRVGSVIRIHVLPVSPFTNEANVLSNAWGTAVGGNGGNGGDVNQQSTTNQYGNDNSGRTARLCPLLAMPADGSAKLHVCSGASVEIQDTASATVSCLQRPQRRRQTPMAAMAAVARLER